MKWGQLSKWAEVRVGWSFALPLFSSFIHSVTEVFAPAPSLSAFYSLFLYFLHLSSLHLFPFHPLPLLAPPPQLLWQQLSARNKGRIQLGHQFPKQHPPRVERGRAGRLGGENREAPRARSVCVLRVHRAFPKRTRRQQESAPCSGPSGSSEQPAPRPSPGPMPFLRPAAPQPLLFARFLFLPPPFLKLCSTC